MLRDNQIMKLCIVFDDICTVTKMYLSTIAYFYSESSCVIVTYHLYTVQYIGWFRSSYEFVWNKYLRTLKITAFKKKKHPTFLNTFCCNCVDVEVYQVPLLFSI